NLPEARRLIFEGRYQEANVLIGKKMMGRPIKQMPYQPLGDVLLDFPGHGVASNFRRELDLDTAIATVSYSVAGIRFTREVFSSPVDQVIVVQLAADRPAQISFTATMNSPQRTSLTTEGKTLLLRGQ